MASSKRAPTFWISQRHCQHRAYLQRVLFNSDVLGVLLSSCSGIAAFSNFQTPSMRASSRMTLHPTPPPQPLLRSINHACKFKDDITPHPPHPNPCSVASTMRASSRMTLHPTPHPNPCYVASTMRASSRMTLHPTPPTPTPVQGWRCHEKRGKSAGRFSTRRLKQAQYKYHSATDSLEARDSAVRHPQARK